ncbi:hypothetical protein D7Y25_23200, partial [Parabacteroides goldsteinii]
TVILRKVMVLISNSRLFIYRGNIQKPQNHLSSIIRAAGQLPPGIFAHLDLYYVICVTQFTQ